MGNHPPKQKDEHKHMSQGRSTPYIGDGRPPTFNDGNPYFMGPYKPLRNWVDEFIPYYMEIMRV